MTARRSSAPSYRRRSPANPFISFFTTATRSGRIEFSWTGDNGFVASEAATITVE